MPQKKPVDIRHPCRRPVQHALQIAGQIVILPDDAPPTRTPTVAPKIDGDHIEVERRAESVGNSPVRPAMFAETVGDDHNTPRPRATPPPATEHRAVSRP